MANQFGNQDLKNSFYFHKGINTAQSFKIILVVNYYDIKDERALNFTSLIKTMTRYFQNLETIKDNCLIIVSKCRSSTSLAYITKRIK